MQKTLPKGWKWERLGEACEFTNGLWEGKNSPFEKVKILRNTNFNGDGTFDYSDAVEFEVERKQLQSRLLECGDIILERSGGGPTQPVGRVALFTLKGDNYSFSNFTTRIRVKDKNGVNTYFLWRFLRGLYTQGFTERIQRQTHGIKNLEFDLYKKLLVPLPPLPTQHKIVEILEEADNLRKLRRQADEKTKNLIPSLFVQMFGDPATNPKGWKMKKLGDVVDKVSLQIMPTDYPDTEFVYIGLEHIESNTGQLAKINYQSGESIKSSKNKFEKGDILYGKLRPYLNKVWLSDRSGICSTDIWVIRPINDKTTGYFISTFLRFQQIVKRLNSKTEGANLPRVKTESFNKIPLPLPPLQQEFAKLVEEVEAEKARQAESRKKLDELFQSLIQRAFTGELVA